MRVIANQSKKKHSLKRNKRIIVNTIGITNSICIGNTILYSYPEPRLTTPEVGRPPFTL